jgi:SAM-dependent methyltransferase
MDKCFYDDRYKDARPPSLTLEAVRSHWFDDTRPENLAMLESLGDVSGKRVLLLGNGTSLKELYLLHLGAEVVFTDVSVWAVKHVRQVLLDSELGEAWQSSIEFHAVDALHMPFPDSSFDIIYGYAFVHHIDDLDPFFAEVSRCLRTDGICRFLDCAHSPLWEFARRTVVRPLLAYADRRTGISPEDARADKRGGYSEQEVTGLMRRFGFKDAVFIRNSLFLRMTRRGLGRLIGWSPKVFRRARPLLRLMRRIDTLLARNRLMRKNLITLVWGFTK